MTIIRYPVLLYTPYHNVNTSIAIIDSGFNPDYIIDIIGTNVSGDKIVPLFMMVDNLGNDKEVKHSYEIFTFTTPPFTRSTFALPPGLNSLNFHISSGAALIYFSDKTLGVPDIQDQNASSNNLGVYIRRDGGAPWEADQSVAGYQLNDLGVPTNDDDAANKIYVDQQAAFNQPSTGYFWTAFTAPLPPYKVGAVHIDRFNDRVFIGGATVNSGDFPESTPDWYEAYEMTRSSIYGFRTSWSTLAVLNQVGGIGILGAVRSSDSIINNFQLGIGVMAAAINDNTVQQQLTTSFYSVAWRKVGAGIGVNIGTCAGEFDIANEGNSVQNTPGTLYPATGFTIGLQINSGAAYAGSHTASAALVIANNRADFYAGIVIGQTSIAGIVVDGTGKPIAGGGDAMRLSTFMNLTWWTYPWGSPTFSITSVQLTPANIQSIVCSDIGIGIGGPANAGLAIQTLYPGGATAIPLGVTPANGANPLTLSAYSGGIADLRFSPGAGGGHISFGTYTNAPSAVVGYITITDYAGTLRKLAVIS